MSSRRTGFTLMEVVLAIGVFAMGVLSLVGIFAAMLGRSHSTPNLSDDTTVLIAARVYLEQQPRDQLDAQLRVIDSIPLVLYLTEMEQTGAIFAPPMTFASEEEWPLSYQSAMTTASSGNLHLKSVHKFLFTPMASPPQTAASIPLQVSIFDLAFPAPGESLLDYEARNQGLIPSTYFINLRR